MTKAEYLENIGYMRRLEPETLTYQYEKLFDNKIMIINIQLNNFGILVGYVETQEGIDNLQIAFNNVQRDFEEMIKYEE